jgi:hypothetical protein
MKQKLDKEHLEEIQATREAFANNARELGNIAIERAMVRRQTEMLDEAEQKALTAFDSLRQQEQELLDRMRERYGDGSINLAEGTFTPNGLDS